MQRRGQLLAVCLLVLSLFAGVAPPRDTAAAGERWCPPQTGFCAENAFYDYWRAHGALEILGYPIDNARRTPSGLIIQFYERAVMEYHPENSPEFQVLLTLLGTFALGDNPVTRQPPVPCSANCALFPETNHTLRDVFLNYWQSYGGLPVYGYPLTEQMQELNAADGKVYTVQYFERNRFEYHPENAGTRYEVQLGRLGAEFLDAIGAEVRAYPVVSVPNYGGTAPAPPAPQPTPQPSASPPPAPAPTPPPAPPAASPVVTVSPGSGPAGTKFDFTGTNFPAGAVVNWAINSGGTGYGAGSFQLDPGTTSFNFSLTTDGAPSGNYTMTFSVAGRAIGSANFTITAPPSAPGAAQFKSQATNLINQAIPSLQDVISTCPGANPYICQAKYDTARRAYAQLGDGLFNLAGSLPAQCNDLFSRVVALRREGAKWLEAPYTPTRQGLITGGEATNRAYQAGLYLIEARRIIAEEPGACR